MRFILYITSYIQITLYLGIAFSDFVLFLSSCSLADGISHSFDSIVYMLWQRVVSLYIDTVVSSLLLLGNILQLS